MTSIEEIERCEPGAVKVESRQLLFVNIYHFVCLSILSPVMSTCRMSHDYMFIENFVLDSFYFAHEVFVNHNVCRPV